ncbi:hypothetical protein [Bacillus licheniformis]|uniref:hypothetical protein n=1 Tax=Bacillus licheniformis TaxID=1402 RepID=UPI00237CC4C2|nr:hypothetical protein [Bacillus licheniformis]MDE1407041.1 hypothetical protein [Bacillus licheniformis]
MSSVAREMIEDHERMARRIQNFIWEGKPFKSKKIEHTVEEFEDFLEGLRKDCWDSYDTGACEMGWRK